MRKSKEGVDNPQWSPDGKSIFFAENVARKEKDDVKVIDRLTFWFNGLGFTYNKRKHLFRMGANGGTPARLTRGEFDVNAFSISARETQPMLVNCLSMRSTPGMSKTGGPPGP